MRGSNRPSTRMSSSQRTCSATRPLTPSGSNASLLHPQRCNVCIGKHVLQAARKHWSNKTVYSKNEEHQSYVTGVPSAQRTRSATRPLMHSGSAVRLLHWYRYIICMGMQFCSKALCQVACKY